jgi:predicted nuclease of predicted toxin-antitoxin system
MNILIDMNLSPAWVSVFQKYGFHAKHWSEIGKADALDEEIFEWARENRYVIFTHDLDFGTLLAYTQSGSPSVIQVRAQNIMPSHLKKTIIRTLQQNEHLLNQGTLIVVDEAKFRIRVLPLNKN